MSGHLIWNLWNTLGNFGILLAKARKNTEITQTRFINFILTDHESKILLITWPFRWQKMHKIY